MARPMYPHEQGDPDFSWLITTFLEQNPNYIQLQSTCLPVVLIEAAVPLGNERFSDAIEGEGEEDDLSDPEIAALRKREGGA